MKIKELISILLISLFSSPVLADLVSLDCVVDDDKRIEFDIDRDNGISEKRIPSTGGAWTNLETTVSPSQITITQSGMIRTVHRINRKDLSYSDFYSHDYGSGSSEGQCKVVEREMADNLI